MPQARRHGCLGFMLICFVGAVVFSASYALLAPRSTTFLLLGADSTVTQVGPSRTDVIALVAVTHHPPKIEVVSLPRDLWVEMPGGGFNRLNAAHALHGPEWTANTITRNFGIDVHRWAVMDYADFRHLIDAIGGIDVRLPTRVGHLSAGRHHLGGAQALWLVRQRKGSNDFERMRRLQEIILPATLRRVKHHPRAWIGLAWFAVRYAAAGHHKGMLLWLPYVAITVIRTNDVSNFRLSREMVRPVTRENGAEVLCPNWDRIVPELRRRFPDVAISLSPVESPDCTSSPQTLQHSASPQG